MVFEPARPTDEQLPSVTLLRQIAPLGRAGMNGEESPPTRRPEPMGGVPKLERRRATGYGEFRILIILIRDAPCGSAGSFT